MTNNTKFFSLLPLLLFLSAPVQATLGEKDTSVLKLRQTLGASYKAAKKDKYTVHELSANGNIIKEFAAADGTIFAVSWRGIKRPDLSLLLGSHSAEYSAADSVVVRGHGRQPISLKTSHLVVHKGGHMRDIRGQAYLPDLIPTGVQVEELQ